MKFHELTASNGSCFRGLSPTETTACVAVCLKYETCVKITPNDWEGYDLTVNCMEDGRRQDELERELIDLTADF